MGKMCCNLCGNELDIWDKSEDFSVNKQLGYGTKYDGDIISLNICCKCMENIIDKCKINPILNLSRSE